MAVSCEPADLAEAAACFTCLTREQKELVRLYLLAVIAGGSTDPATLATEAACFVCLDENQKKLVNTYLLCQAANGGAAPTDCDAQEGANSPVGAATPDFVGQLYHETGDDTYWRSTGLTNADWVEISGAAAACGLIWGPDPTSVDFIDTSSSLIGSGKTELTYPTLLSGGGIYIESSQLTLLSCPLMTEADGIDLITSDFVTINLPSLETADYFAFNDNVDLVNLNLDSLVTLGAGDLYGRDCSNLVSLQLPSLVTISGGVTMNGCVSLTTVSFPLYLPTNGAIINFSDCALTAASVNHILARAVANAGYVTGTIDTSLGTNAAPTGQGIADKATLIGRGCTVTTN